MNKVTVSINIYQEVHYPWSYLGPVNFCIYIYSEVYIVRCIMSNYCGIYIDMLFLPARLLRKIFCLLGSVSKESERH